MYTQQDYLDINAQFSRKLRLMLLLEALLLAGLVYSLVIRLKWLTILISCVMGAIAIFYTGMTLSPLYAYRKFIRQLLSGRQRELTGRFKGFDAHEVLRDNVRYLSFLLNIGEQDEPQDDRQLYFDINLPRPDWQEGDRLWVQSFDKAVTQWRLEAGAQGQGS